MRISSRLQTFGHWGVTDPPPFAFNCLSRAILEQAVKSGLRTLNLGDDGVILALDYDLHFPAATNISTEYNALFGYGPDLRGLNAFTGTPKPGVWYSNGTPNNPAAFRTTTYKVPANTPHAIRANLAKKPKAQALQLDQFRWGGWIFEILSGKPQLLKVSAGWSQAQEDALHALLANDERTAEQETAMATIKETIYEVYESLDLNARGDDWYGTNWVVTFVPEPRGVVHVFLEGAGFDSVEVERLIEARSSDSVVWPEGPVTFRTYGGAAYWQLGYPLFAVRGEARFINRLPAEFDSVGIDFDYNKTELEGTTISAIARDEGVAFVVYLTFTASGDRRRTPFLYSFTATRLAGDRTGLEEESFDTADLGSNPIKDISIAYDGPFNRRTATVLFRDINGGTLSAVGVAGYGYDALENRTGDLDIKGTRWMTTGVVVDSRQSKMRKATANQARPLVTKGETDVQITIADMWQILDETPCDPGIICDGDYLGQSLRKALNLAGVKGAEMVRVGTTTGPIIGRAAPGEEWSESANPDATIGDYCRHLMECYGLGLMFRIAADGVWELQEPSTEVVAAFVSAHTGNPNQDAHRRIILDPLEYIRDYSNFCTRFLVVGGKGADGKPITYLHRVSGAESYPAGPNYVGRKKPYQTIRNEGLDTKSKVVYAGRSAAWLYGRMGRFAQFTTFFDPSILPWDRITADGALYEVTSIAGASLASDRMQIIGRQL